MRPLTPWAVALLMLACVAPARAQNRNAQIAAAQQAYDGFDPARAAQLLRVALNPATGPTDSSWARGVQLLTQILLEDKKDSMASVWARWAVRLAPGLQVDSVTYLPQVVATIRSARNSVAARPGPGEALTRTTWDWDWPSAGVRDPMGGVRPGVATVPSTVRLLVVGVGLLTPGQTLPLNPGTYDVQATADGYVTAYSVRSATQHRITGCKPVRASGLPARCERGVRSADRQAGRLPAMTGGTPVFPAPH